MNYHNIYNQLISKAQNRECDPDSYYENHHIIPSCIGGPNTKDNLVPLTFREHYVCHWLLTKIHTGSQDAMSLASAFWKMTQSSGNQKRNLTSRQFERARKHYMDNHPMKDESIVKKVGEAVSLRWQDPAFRAKQRELHIERSLKENPNYIEDITIETRYCECGCGETFEVEKRSPRVYVKSSHRIQDCDHLSKVHKERLSKLTEEEMKERMKKSAGSADHKLRGEAISLGKKGKPTNQQQIMGERYANMSDDEFNEFLLTKKPRIHKRIINLRNKYKIYNP